MPAVFLTAFGFKSPDQDAAPVFIYAGYSHQEQFAAIVAASLTVEFDHFMIGNSAAFSLVGVFTPRAKDPAELAAEETDKDQRPKAKDAKTKSPK